MFLHINSHHHLLPERDVVPVCMHLHEVRTYVQHHHVDGHIEHSKKQWCPLLLGTTHIIAHTLGYIDVYSIGTLSVFVSALKQSIAFLAMHPVRLTLVRVFLISVCSEGLIGIRKHFACNLLTFLHNSKTNAPIHLLS